jgi:hypothetical protein
MVMWAGLKLKPWITTVLVGCLPATAVGCLLAPVADTTNGVLSRTTAATAINKTMRLISVTSSSYFSRPSVPSLKNSLRVIAMQFPPSFASIRG